MCGIDFEPAGLAKAIEPDVGILPATILAPVRVEAENAQKKTGRNEPDQGGAALGRDWFRSYMWKVNYCSPSQKSLLCLLLN